MIDVFFCVNIELLPFRQISDCRLQIADCRLQIALPIAIRGSLPD